MKIGVVLGKFQTPYLTRGHKHLLTMACGHSDQLAVFIIDNEIPFSTSCPLPYEIREANIQRFLLTIYKNPVKFFRVKDQKYASTLQFILDNALTKTYGNTAEFTFYSGPSGFASRYSGISPVKIIDQLDDTQTSEDARRLAYDTEIANINFHMGMVHALNYRKPVCHNMIISIILMDKGYSIVDEGSFIITPDDNKFKRKAFPLFELSPEYDSIEEQSEYEVQELLPEADFLPAKLVKTIKGNHWKFHTSNDYCYYHIVTHRIANNPKIPINFSYTATPVNKDEFEDDFHNIIDELQHLWL